MRETRLTRARAPSWRLAAPLLVCALLGGDATAYGPDPNAVYSVPVAHSPVWGSMDALVTIVESVDLQCPFCARAQTTLEQVVQTYGKDVRLVFKHNPLPFHKEAMPAALAAEAAGAQGKFWEMQRALLENSRSLGRDLYVEQARQLGLDAARFEADLDSQAARDRIAADQALMLKLGARGTPAFWINGRPLAGAQPFESFKTLIDEELTKARDATVNGMPRKLYYEAIVARGITEVQEAPRGVEGGTDRPAGPDPANVYSVRVGTSAQKGPDDALVTIVESSEFQCPYCRRVQPALKQIAETYGNDVRFLFKHNPMPFHKEALAAAKAAEAAGEQGKFWQMHDRLFENADTLSAENYLIWAAELSLDLPRFKRDMASPAIEKRIKDQQDYVMELGARGVPTFWINGRHLRGAQPFESFAALIDEELAKAREAVSAGTPPEAYYDKLVRTGLKKM